MGSVVSNDPGTITQPAQMTTGTRRDFPVGEKVYTCDVCGQWWPKSRFHVFEGKRYCVPNTCYMDIKGIIRSRLPVRVPNDVEEELK